MNVQWNSDKINKEDPRKFFSVVGQMRKKQDSCKLEKITSESNPPPSQSHHDLLIKLKEYDKNNQSFCTNTATELEEIDMLLPDPEISAPSKSNDLYIYDRYNFDVDYDKDLPVVKQRDKILNIIRANRVCIIAGSTGSGKTTVIPQFIFDEFANDRKYCNIIITQPRRVAAVSAAKRVASERGCECGTLVGYSISLQKAESEDTRIHFVTTGVLLQCLVSNPKIIESFTHIIVDEVHERTEEIDLVLLMIKTSLNDSLCTKIILMSATLETNSFTDYFSSDFNHCIIPAPLLEIEGRMFDVTTYYLGEIPMIDSNGFDLDEPILYDFSISTCLSIITNLHNFDRDIDDNSGMLKSVLVFLPGLFEIYNVFNKLKVYCEKYKLDVYMLHSKIPPDDQYKIFKLPRPGYRKVILATNIAESSITVPDIGYVIDFCLQKFIYWDKYTNLCRLKMSWISKSSGEQRRGRAGRVCNGICFRLVYRELYETFDQFNLPDIKRKPLERVVLNIKRYFKGSIILMLQLVIDPPLIDDILRSIIILKEIGALTLTKNGRYDENDGEVTFLGEIIRLLPLDIKTSKLIALGNIFNVLDECVIMGVFQSLGCINKNISNKELQLFETKLDKSQNTKSDLISYINMYKEFYTQYSEESDKLHKWAKQNNINLNKMQEIRKLAEDVFAKLFDIGIEPHMELFNRDYNNDENLLFLLRIVISGAYYPNYFISDNKNIKNITKSYKFNPLTTVKIQNYKKNCQMSIDKLIYDLFSVCGRIVNIYNNGKNILIEFDDVNSVAKALYLRKLPLTSSLHQQIKNDLSFPINPLSLMFSNICRNNQFKNVVLGHESCNSVILRHHENYDDFTFIVSSNISITSSSSSLLINNITLFPDDNSHYLDLLVLLFTPACILRTDHLKSRYTSALCGLGYNPDTYDSLLPCNDIDLSFSQFIDNSDIQTINLLRSYLSSSLGVQKGLPQRYIELWRPKMLDVVFNLFQKQRKVVIKRPSEVEYNWKFCNNDPLYSINEDRIYTNYKETY